MARPASTRAVATKKSTAPAKAPSELRGAARAAAARKAAARRVPRGDEGILASEDDATVSSRQLRLELPSLSNLVERPFRTELLVDQASVFVANSFQGESFARERRDRDAKSGRWVTRRMSVGQIDRGGRTRGVLREYHQNVYFKLLEIWEKDGHPVATVRGKRHGLISSSRYELVRAVFGGNDNMRSYKRAAELLRDLQAIPVVLTNEYDSGETDREEFTLLDSVTWSERAVDKDGIPTADGKSVVSIMLSSMITEGFFAKRIRVLLGRPYDALGGTTTGRRPEHARLLFPLLNRELEKREEYQVGLDALAEYFGFRRYAHPSKRKEKWSPAVRALDGMPILEGKYTLRVDLIQRREDVFLRAVRVVR